MISWSIACIFSTTLLTHYSSAFTTKRLTTTGWSSRPRVWNQRQEILVPEATDTNSSSSVSPFSSDRYLNGADNLLHTFKDETERQNDETSRRLFFASSLIMAGSTLAAADPAFALSKVRVAYDSNSKLQWESTPVNKRTGVTVYDAEQAGYNVRFVTYLSRFLLCFDEDCQRWWYARAADIPRTANRAKVTELRLQQFAAFSASIEVGLQEYRGPNGPKRLLQALLTRYCPDMGAVRAVREDSGQPPMSQSEIQREDREIKEARRQIALLFGLLEKNQPTDEILKLLAAIDNGSISSVRILDHGGGYAPGYGPPEVKFPRPKAGDKYVTATGRATLRPNGRILRIDLVNRGGGYTKAPVITIAPPAAIRFDDESASKSETAEAKAMLFKNGANKGRIERIQLVNPGAGYTANEIIQVRISPPDLAPQEGGVAATATAVLEYEVGEILIINNGTGYAVEKPISVYVEPPPMTARVNMNDPLMARIVAPDQPLPATTVPSKEMLKKMPAPEDPTSLVYRVTSDARADGKGGAGGCIGRACYDRKVVATAYARAEKDSYNSFQNVEDAGKPGAIEEALELRGATAFKEMQAQVRVSASESDSSETGRYMDFGLRSPSSQLLSLLPSGVGLEFNSELGRYQLAADPSVADSGMRALQEPSTRALDPDFGPRGRSPIEREMKLGISTYLRFVASGAICCSGVHLALTPIDVVKTKVQTDPQKYPGVLQAFKRIADEEGMGTFFTGWVPTFLGFFVWGGVSYALTEFLRRTITESAGSAASDSEVLIILLASGLASIVGCFFICPFEAVRIRSVAQPNFAPGIVNVFKRMVDEEGLSSLFSAVPVFFTKEIPFAMAKFTVFDVSTAMMYEAFPAANEDLQLSLLVSLAGGTLGGFSAAVVSNPADVTISEMKKAKTDVGPVDAAKILLERGGFASFFRGLPLRLVFYALIVSLQFLVYDAVRFALGIGKDDLKLYLDVLGGALSESGGPV